MSLLSDLGTAIRNKLGGSSTDNAIPKYNGTTCKLQNTGVTISDANVVTASGFVGNLTGTATNATNATNATQLKTARTINGVLFNGTANITVADSTAVKLTENQTIAGVKTFSSSPIVPTPTTNTQVANKAYVDSKAGGAAFVANDPRVKTALNATGNAPIYACRAWVNFNGTGTVAIRASGNVSSITDNGAGDYTVNFTTAMTDANYAVALSLAGYADVAEIAVPHAGNFGPPMLKTASSIRVRSNTSGGSLGDAEEFNVSIQR